MVLVALQDRAAEFSAPNQQPVFGLLNLGAHRLQQGHVARPLVAEAEIPAHHHMPRGQVGDKYFSDEGLGRLEREGMIEVLHEEVVDARLLQSVRLGPQRGKPKRRLVRQENRTRMRFESQHDQRRRERVGDTSRIGQQHLVAAMHPVEVADDHHGASGGGGRIAGMPKYCHKCGWSDAFDRICQRKAAYPRGRRRLRAAAPAPGWRRQVSARPTREGRRNGSCNLAGHPPAKSPFGVQRSPAAACYSAACDAFVIA